MKINNINNDHFGEFVDLEHIGKLEKRIDELWKDTKSKFSQIDIDDLNLIKDINKDSEETLVADIENDIGKLSNLVRISEESGLNAIEIEEYLRSGNDAQLIRTQDKRSRELGISGVPCFIINDEFVVSGAQEPEVFLQVFDAANEKTSRKSVTPDTAP